MTNAPPIEDSEPTEGNEPAKRRRRSDLGDMKERLLDSAIVEFGQKGFDGASTTSIAKRADSYQPQINYHFGGKADLWRAAVNRLFQRLGSVLADIDFEADLAAGFALIIRRLVAFSAVNPQLSQILGHESAAPSDRLDWLMETHLERRYNELARMWRQLQSEGIAAPIDARIIHYVLTGAASTLFLNEAEAQHLIGVDLRSPEILVAHADGLVATLLPNLSNRKGT